MSSGLSRDDSEKELNEKENTNKNSDQNDRIISHRTSYFIPKQRQGSASSKESTPIIITEDSNNNNNNRPSSSNLNNGSRLMMKHTSSIYSQKSAQEDEEINNDDKINKNKNINKNNIKSRINMLKLPTISLSNPGLSNSSQNDIFMPPQIILSFDDDIENDSNNTNEINNKVLYTSNQGYRIGEEKIVNSYEDLDRIINFGYEKEPETDGFSVIRSKKPQEELGDEEELEEKRRNSIKYADSGVKFGKFNNNDDIQDDNEMEDNTDYKSQSSPTTKNKTRRNSIKDKNKSSNSKSEEGVENQPEFPIKKASLSLQTPSLISSPKRGRRYSTMAYVPIKDSKITSDKIGSMTEQMKLKSQVESLNGRASAFSDMSNPYTTNKYSFSVREFIPTRGLIYSEFQDYKSSWVLCKPKLLPLKSIEIQKIEKMEKAVVKARQNTGLRLTRTASSQNSMMQKPRSKEVHTSPSIINN